MAFGSGVDSGATRSAAAFDFGLAPSAHMTGAAGGGDPRRNRRRRSAPDRAVLFTVAIVVILAAVVVLVAGLVAMTLVQTSEAKVKEDSAAFCADIASTPGVLAQPGFGWPTQSADIPTTVAAMQAYQQRWAQLADIAPPTIRAELSAIAESATTVITRVESSQSIDRPGNLATIASVTSQTVIPSWAAKYCD